MTGSFTRGWLPGVLLCAVAATGAEAQAPLTYSVRPAASVPSDSPGELHGVILDDHGAPLRGVIVSATVSGAQSRFALSDTEGRYAFRNIPPGSYLVRAYLQGYASPRGRYVQVASGRRQTWKIALSRTIVEAPRTDAPPRVLTAGVGGVPGEAAAAGADDNPRDEDTEVEWRLRHSRRGVLKESFTAAIERTADVPDTALAALRHTFESSARLVSLFDTVDGQVNLLTTTSFDRPQDLFRPGAAAPRPVAYVALVAPLANGDWEVRGSMTQGDISSWILAGSFTRAASDAPHRYQVGLSYAAQSYQGGNVDALAAFRDGSRNVGEIYAEDSWAILPRLTLVTGGRYASYDYLADRFLLGGRMGVSYQVSADDPLRLRVSASHRELAPGAEEFEAPASGMWLPPERTFSPLSRGTQLRPEKVDIVEVAGERPVGENVIVGLRAFRQQIGDQLVTVFGLPAADGVAPIGHYYVASAGDFENYGWGTTVTGQIAGGTRASVDYTMTDTERRGVPDDRRALRMAAPGMLRRGERVHDLTASIDSRVAVTATRFLVVYKLNNAYSVADSRMPEPGARFEVQINQEMPFLDFTGARWEMLVGVRNLFRSELFDGSVYDELMVVQPPKRITGGVTVRF